MGRKIPRKAQGKNFLLDVGCEVNNNKNSIIFHFGTIGSDEFLRGYTRNIEPRTCEIVNRVLNFV